MLPTTSRVNRILPIITRVTANVNSISSFLTMSYLDSIIRETVSRTREGSISISLIDSVMAFGYQAYLTTSQRSMNSEERKRAHQYAKIPLRSRGNVLRSPNTLLKFQVNLTLHAQELLSADWLDDLSNGGVSSARTDILTD